MTTVLLPGRTVAVRAVVTGGAGFIGSTLVCALVADGHDVTVIDNLSRGTRANLNAVAEQITLCALDIIDPELSEVFARAAPEVVFLLRRIDLRQPGNVADR